MLAAGTGIVLSLLVPLASTAQSTGGALAGAKDPRQGAFKEYAGAAVCKVCHASQYEAWSRSHHRQAMQVADAESVLGNFRNAKFVYAKTTSIFSTRDGKYLRPHRRTDGKLADFEIKYTFVSSRCSNTDRVPGGKLRRRNCVGLAARAQGGQRWFHLYPDRTCARDPLHWTGINQN
jgi:hypothetical protein